MDLFLWTSATRDHFSWAWPLLSIFFVYLFATFLDYPILLLGFFWARVRGRADPFVARGPGGRPAALVIIPSLLHDQDDYSAITLTLDSCATNAYPGSLLIVASIDGAEERPDLVEGIEAFIAAKSYPKNVRVIVAKTKRRSGKMMSVETAVHLVQQRLAAGLEPCFPPIYFSIDGDGTLAANAIERMVDRLMSRNPVTGNMRRVVAGKCCIRPDLFWQGWSWLSFKNYFTVSGQIYRQVAREFTVSNVVRYNLRPRPQVCIPGGLYCTWAEVLLAAPYFMGFMRTITFSDWLKWWIGFPPPRFSESRAPALPEALTGPSDDTCISFIAQMGTWHDGRLSFDAPRTPLHAFGRLLLGYFLERTPAYAPEARVYTYTPSTIKGLWLQRIRWNASRYECSFRFKNALAFHWNVGAHIGLHWVYLTTFMQAVFYYVLLPFAIIGSRSVLFAFLVGYATQLFVTTFFTLAALVLERQRRLFWPVLLAIPLSPAYSIAINLFSALAGISKDLFFFGNRTKFAPEWTFIRGKTVRVAILFRLRRALALCVRAVVVHDVPFGSFWFGWRETPWTPNGYTGWTTGEKQKIVPPFSQWFPELRSKK